MKKIIFTLMIICLAVTITSCKRATNDNFAAKNNENNSSDTYKEEFLPITLGYVERIAKDDGSMFYKAESEFSTRQDLTERIISASLQYPTELSSEIDTANVKLEMHYNDEENLQQLEESLNNNSVIVKGHFEQKYPTSICNYSLLPGGRELTSCNFKRRDFTGYKFVIDKIYTKNSTHKKGDTIEVTTDGAIVQDFDGYFYPAYSSPGYFANFKDASLEQRTYVLSFFYSENLGVYRIDGLCQNAYEKVTDSSGDAKTQIAYDILQKYN